ncbi:MAG TPA: hypothetical protein VNR18_14415 [Hyphomicrobiales bacterium]|nr:hypothetical protein [Hyphomicrobiales bacterium]
MNTLTTEQTLQVAGGGCVYASQDYDVGAVIQVGADLYQICTYDAWSSAIYYWDVYSFGC